METSTMPFRLRCGPPIDSRIPLAHQAESCCRELPQGLIERDAGGGGKIQAALTRRLWDAQSAGGVLAQQRLGQAGGLIAEDEPPGTGTEPGMSDGAGRVVRVASRVSAML
jgi:hypothetical protein